jgi:hypothetical protein
VVAGGLTFPTRIRGMFMYVL